MRAEKTRNIIKKLLKRGRGPLVRSKDGSVIVQRSHGVHGADGWISSEGGQLETDEVGFVLARPADLETEQDDETHVDRLENLFFAPRQLVDGYLVSVSPAAPCVKEIRRRRQSRRYHADRQGTQFIQHTREN